MHVDNAVHDTKASMQPHERTPVLRRWNSNVSPCRGPSESRMGNAHHTIEEQPDVLREICRGHGRS